MGDCHTPGRTNILGVGISAITMADAIRQITCWIEDQAREYVVVCPVYNVMVCQQDETYRAIVNHAGMVTPDGMPLVFLSRLFGQKHVERVYGPDLMLALSALSEEKGYRHFYYGGAEGVPEALAASLRARFPRLAVAGGFSPPFRQLDALEKEQVAVMINEAAPDIVWVGLGSPKQDFWMAEFRDKLEAPVLIGVGAAFDYHSGRVRQAPRWMRRSGLEWLFRLLSEPRRLWKRYLIYNPLFLLYIILQMLGLRRKELT